MKKGQKIIVITGAAGGIGRQLVKTLSINNFLILVVRDKSKTTDFRVKSKNLKIYNCDLSKSEEIEKLCNKIKSEFVKIDVLINNAAVFKTGRIENLNADSAVLTFKVNVIAPFLLIKNLHPCLKKSKSAHIINVGSTSGYNAWKEGSLYCSSKFALRGLTDSLIEELKSENIRVSLISPGQIDTDMSLLDKNTPLRKKMLTPNDISRLIKFIIDQPLNIYFPEIKIKPLL